jgi:uncharacterized protein YhaN
MVIRRLAIRNFGKIHNTSLTLEPGINVLYGENESGKTTIHTFIKSMFYGMPRSRGRGAGKDAYARYEPWENPADYGGILWFENGGRTFRLTRSFSRERPSWELYCEDDGELMDLDEGDLDVLLGGVSERVYENTVSIAQLKSVTGKELVAELQNYMASFQGTGDASIDLGRAVQMLKMTRKGFQVQEERAARVHAEEMEKLEANIAYVREELENLKLRQTAMENQHVQSTDGVKKDQDAVDSYLELLEARQKKMRMGMAAVSILALVMSFLLPILAGGVLWRVIPVLLAAILDGAAMVYLRQMEAERVKSRKILRRLKKREDKMAWDRDGMQASIREKETALSNLEAELREYEQAAGEPSQARLEVDALNLSMRTMDMLTRQFRSEVGRGLRERVSQILSEITQGRYTEVLIDADFHMQVSTKERIVPAENLSRGTLEQIYFALRMAAGELLCKEECFPVILDDVFGMYDEERLCAVLRWLSREHRQVILSTCSKREAELMEREGIPFHKITLDKF